MYLKIRDSVTEEWVYLDDFDRLEAPDLATININVSDQESIGLTMDDLKARIFGSDEEVAEARVVVLDGKLLMQDYMETGKIRYQLLRCVAEDETGETFYTVALNTSAFLCGERGHTMDRFIVHRVF